MSPRHKSVDSSESSGDESGDSKCYYKDKKDKKYKKEKDKDDKSKDKKEKKDHKEDKDKKDKGKDKDKKDKDKDKDKKDKDSKKEGKSKDGKEAKVFHGGGEGEAAQFFKQTPMDQDYGHFSSPPIVPPTFDANRSHDAPDFPSAPPHYDDSQTAAAPPSGFRVPLTTTSDFPDPAVAGQPPCFDLDGSPVFIGSALFENSVHPCKIGPHLAPFASVPYGGVEHAHHGRFDLLPFVPQTMEWVPTSYGRVPPGRRAVEGGYEENGAKLYHGLAVVNGIRVPGKTGEHLGACNVAFGGSEIAVTEHEILCWR